MGQVFVARALDDDVAVRPREAVDDAGAPVHGRKQPSQLPGTGRNIQLAGLLPHQPRG